MLYVVSSVERHATTEASNTVNRHAKLNISPEFPAHSRPSRFHDVETVSNAHALDESTFGACTNASARSVTEELLAIGTCLVVVSLSPLS